MRKARSTGMIWMAMVACTGHHVSKKTLDDPERAGSALQGFGNRYSDNNVSLSDDGTHIVFVSGRDSSDQAATFKAYKSDWVAGSEPVAPIRVTNDDSVGIEKDAWLSPDGKWVVLLSSNGGRTDLFLQDYAGAKTPVQITNDAAFESSATFSPDSQLLAWVGGDPSAGTFVAQVVAIGDGTAAAVATKYTLTKPETVVRQLAWVPVASGYELAIGSLADGGNGKDTFVLRSFASVDAAPDATDRPWLAEFNPDLSVTPLLFADMALLARKLVSTDRVLIDQVGSGVAAPPLQTLIKTEPVWANYPEGTPLDRYVQPPGFQVLAMAGSKDASALFFLDRQYYICKDDSQSGYGTAIVSATSDINVPLTAMSPRVTADGVNFEIAAGPCERTRADATVGHVDDKMTELAVVRNATPSKFRMVYVTRFSNKFDASCVLKSGDTEVMALDVDGETKTVTPVSGNQAPLVSDEPSGAACVL